MCRGPVLFKGLRKIQDALEEKRWSAAYDDKYAEVFDELLDYTFRVAKIEARVFRLHDVPVNIESFVSRRCILTLRGMEVTFRTMKSMDEHPDVIGDVINSDINYKRAVERARHREWRRREPVRGCAPQRRTQIRRFVNM
jgi:hypothetical protein